MYPHLATFHHISTIEHQLLLTSRNLNSHVGRNRLQAVPERIGNLSKLRYLYVPLLSFSLEPSLLRTLQAVS